MGRRLGQHFLTNPAILDRIVEALEPEPDDIVLEIGAGAGTLTRRLAQRVAWVIAIEKDPLLAEGLLAKGLGETEPEANATRSVTVPPDAIAGSEWWGRQGGPGKSSPARIHPVQADALALDWHEALEEALRPQRGLPRFKIVGNIPYYITTPLIEKALSPPLPERVVFLVQREVGERLAAAPGSRTYGALSAGVQATAQVETLFTVRAGAFSPPPKVDSLVVRLMPRAAPLVTPDEQTRWRAFLAAVFSQRRKQLGRIVRNLTQRDKPAVDGLLADRGLDPELRPEALSPQQLVALFHGLSL